MSMIHFQSIVGAVYIPSICKHSTTSSNECILYRIIINVNVLEINLRRFNYIIYGITIISILCVNHYFTH